MVELAAMVGQFDRVKVRSGGRSKGQGGSSLGGKGRSKTKSSCRNAPQLPLRSSKRNNTAALALQANGVGGSWWAEQFCAGTEIAP